MTNDPKLYALLAAAIDYGYCLGRASYDGLRPENVAETEAALERAWARMREAREAVLEGSIEGGRTGGC